MLKAEIFELPQDAAGEILDEIPGENRDTAAELLSAPFTPGKLAMAAEDWGLSGRAAMALTAKAVCASHSEPNADFSEGYWCDHWTYDLDLIENYLAVYPEREWELLFGGGYRWYAPHAAVDPRARRYELTERGLRQYNALTELPSPAHKWVQAGADGEARSILMEKLLLLCAVKTATLDAAGMGVEMEGGKPGWHDALNGLPGLLGSSMAETCELLRLVRFTAGALERHGGEVELYSEIAGLIGNVADALAGHNGAYDRWDGLNRVKESYRASVADGFAGPRQRLGAGELTVALKAMGETLDSGIRAAMAYGNGILPTYFTFEAGRAKAFSPGWLENESVWLHMEYKYLLELLKSGLYEEFSQAFHTAAVPFLDPARYGRSPLENVSFLASSANPDPARWGRGYVARLSGSTAEFLEMWQIMFFGKRPFRMTDEGLALSFTPFIPAYLIPTDGLLRVTFLGSILVTHKCPGHSAGALLPIQWVVKFRDGREKTVDGPALAEEDTRAVRGGLVAEMLVTLKEAEK